MNEQGLGDKWLEFQPDSYNTGMIGMPHALHVLLASVIFLGTCDEHAHAMAHVCSRGQRCGIGV